MGNQRLARWDLRVPMRDGATLSADLFPASSATPRPVALHRTPYLTTNPLFVRQAQYLASEGFHVVLQDVRGRGDSDGEWDPFRNEGSDGYDTIEWLAEQEWCDGQVAMFGGSYSGWVQWAAARERPPHLRTLISSAASGHWMRELPWRNGMFTLSSLIWLFYTGGRKLRDLEHVDWDAVFAHLPVCEMPAVLGRDLPTFLTWLEHSCLDEYWGSLLLTREDFARIDLPVLHITGTYDADQPGALFFYEGMTSHSPAAKDQALLMGPWDHWGACGLPSQQLGGFDFGAESVLPVASTVHVAWLRHHLDGVEHVDLAQESRTFLTGANIWHSSASWPPDARMLELYLGEVSSTNADVTGGLWPQPASSASHDTYRYDPMDPVIPVAGANLAAQDGNRDATSTLDLSPLIARPDVLSYDAPAQVHALVLSGRPELTLVATSDCLDTDWVCALHDVAEDGHSQLLTKGALRARFRESFAAERLLEPGVEYAYEIPFEAIGHVVLPGHRLRLTVTSSDFPACDRNLNTGGRIGYETQAVVATNSIIKGGTRGSVLRLPVPAREDVAQ